MSKELIIFDLYNTLVTDPHVEKQHEYRLNSLWAAIEKSGFPTRFSQVIQAYEETQQIMQEYHKSHFSLSVFDLVDIFANKLLLTDITLLKKFYDIWAYASLQYSVELIPYVKEGLATLKENGKKIALISNTSMTPGLVLRFILKEKGIYHLFDDFVFSDEFGFMKPEKSIFHRVLDRFSIPANKAYFIGDHEFYDKVGSTSVGIDYLYMCPKTDFRCILEKII